MENKIPFSTNLHQMESILQAQENTKLFPLDETHLDAVRGLM